MNKTLMFLSTHFVDEAVISEYLKMRNTPSVDAILAIDNTACKYTFDRRIENKIFYGVKVKCFFFDSKLHDEMELPYFVSTGEKNFAGVMWNNGDYRFYYVRKFFPYYNYYWQFDYDVFCNAKTYEGFLRKFEYNRADLLSVNLENTADDEEGFVDTNDGAADWIYKNLPIYTAFFPAVRLSARATDFLYKRRLAHAKIFHEDGGKNKWIFSERFTATELIHNGFYCAQFNAPEVHLENFYLNDDRFFLTPDDKLYHPVKPVKKKISDLNVLLRKTFFNSMLAFFEKFNLRGIPVVIDAKAENLVLPVFAGGGGDKLYYVVKIIDNSIYVSIILKGRFADVDLSEFANMIKANEYQQIKTKKDSEVVVIFKKLDKGIDDAYKATLVLKNLMTNTYPIVRKLLN